MKLLIVDDQLPTLNGIANGIDWAKEGISVINTAQNAMEARICIENGVPDIMLCDIEMPVENGIELCKWMRWQGYDTKIIFLTCHSDFDYARDAVSIDAVEYILQPASYDQIRLAVRKAINKASVISGQKQAFDTAQRFQSKQSLIWASMWRDYLTSTVSWSSIADLSRSINAEDTAFLILVQTVQWDIMEDAWDVPLFTAALDNIAKEIFLPNQMQSITVLMEPRCYSIAVQAKTDIEIGLHTISQKLSYMCSSFDIYMPCGIACYFCETNVLEMPKAWQQLLIQRNNNVSRKRGVYSEIAEPICEYEFHIPQAEYLKELLQDFKLATFEEEATAMLKQLLDDDRLNTTTLLRFYQDFMQAIYSNKKADYMVTQIFNTPKSMELYRNGMKSYEDMKALISYVVKAWSNSEECERNQSTVVQKIVSYINNHLEENVQKEEIVKLVHMNTDYVTKLFHKEMGISIKGYMLQQKMLAAQNLLLTTHLPVSHVAARLGYSNFSHFTYTYKKQFGITPQESQSENIITAFPKK